MRLTGRPSPWMIGSYSSGEGERSAAVAKKTAGIILLALIAMIPLFAAGAEDPIVLFFYADGCPGCIAVDELLTALATDLPAPALHRYEISDPKAAGLLEKLKVAYGIEDASVPIVFVGDDAVVGAGMAQEFQLRDTIGRCVHSACPSPLERIRPPVTAEDVIRLAMFVALLLVFAVWQPHRR